MKRTPIAKIIAALFFISILTVLCTIASSAGEINEMVDILNPKKNVRGDGYTWMNRYDTLYLNNVRINTEDDYGMKVVDGAVIILEGNNYIKAKEAALFIGGTVTIKGSGTLTLVSENTGLLAKSIYTDDKVRLLDGTIKIEAGQYGIYSKYAEIALSGSDVSISVSSSDGQAVNAYTLSFSNGGKVNANAPFYASYKMKVEASNINATAASTVFVCPNKITFSGMNMKAGSDAASLAQIDTYGGEASFSSVSTVKRSFTSTIYGENYPVALDYITMIGAALILAAVIVVPILTHKAKIKKMEAAYAAENAKK